MEGKAAVDERQKNTGRTTLRWLQVFGSLLIGRGVTVLGTLVWNVQDNSGVSTLVLFLLMGPGTMCSVLTNGVHDVSLRSVQIPNFVIYSGIGYVFCAS